MWPEEKEPLSLVWVSCGLISFAHLFMSYSVIFLIISVACIYQSYESFKVMDSSHEA